MEAKVGKVRQHFVPQWLLRHFRCLDARGKKRDPIFAFRRNVDPVRTSCDAVGYAKYFYGHPENGLEDELARVDGRDSLLVQRLLSGEAPQSLSLPIFRMIRQLGVRTDAVRLGGGMAMLGVLERMGQQAAQPHVQTLIRRHLLQNHEVMLHGEFRKLHPDLQRVVPSWLVRAVAWPLMLDTPVELWFSAIIGAVRSRLTPEGITREGHIKGVAKLLSGIDSEAEPPGWQRLRWRVERVEQPDYVLGDCCAFAVDSETKRTVPPWMPGPTPDAMVLPLSPRAVLVGVAPDAVVPVDPEWINNASVRHSVSSFFACRNTEHERMLLPALGSVAAIFSDSDVHELLGDIWDELTNDNRRQERQRLYRTWSWRADAVALEEHYLREVADIRVMPHESIRHLAPRSGAVEQAVVGLLLAPSRLVAVYARRFRLDHLAGRMSMDVTMPMPVTVTLSTGERFAACGGIVSPRGKCGGVTVILTDLPELAFLLPTDAQWRSLCKIV